jgi:hypothetical protein
VAGSVREGGLLGKQQQRHQRVTKKSITVVSHRRLATLLPLSADGNVADGLHVII